MTVLCEYIDLRLWTITIFHSIAWTRIFNCNHSFNARDMNVFISIRTDLRSKIRGSHAIVSDSVDLIEFEILHSSIRRFFSL